MSKVLVRNSLMEKLSDTFPQIQHEKVKFNQYDIVSYQAAVEEDIFVLLNTRSVLDITRYLKYELSVRHFGIPDITHMNPKELLEQNLLVQILHKAIQKYETRLTDVQLTVVECKTSAKELELVIEGMLQSTLGQVVIAFRSKRNPIGGEWY